MNQMGQSSPGADPLTWKLNFDNSSKIVGTTVFYRENILEPQFSVD